MAKAILLAFLVLGLVVASAGDARACAGIYRQEFRPPQPLTDDDIEAQLPYLTTERVLIVYDDATHTEDFVREARFEKANQGFGFVVATPTRPEVFKVDKAPFGTLDADYPFTPPPPPMAHGLAMAGAGAGSLGGASAPEPLPPVVVLSEQRIGSFTAFVLGANDAEGFQRWLDDNGMRTTAATREWLAHYVRLGFFYVAFRYEPPPKGQLSTGMTSETVRIRFQTPNPYFPYREPEPSHPPASSRALLLWFVSQASMVPLAPLQRGREKGAEDPVAWQRPWRSGMKYTSAVDALKRALPGVAEALPESSAPLVVQTFTDYKRSREGFGDVLMVPNKPVLLDAEGLAMRRPLLAVLDPGLEPEGSAPASSAAVGDASVADASPADARGEGLGDATPGAEPASRASHGCAASGASGDAAGGALILGMFAAVAVRRRRMALASAAAAMVLVGCRGNAHVVVTPDAASSSAPVSSAAAAPAAEPSALQGPAPLTDRELAAMDLLSGRLPEAGLKVNAGYAPEPQGINEILGIGCIGCERSRPVVPVPTVSLGGLAMSAPIQNADATVRGRILPQAKRCYQKGLESDPTQSGRLIVSIKVTQAGEVDAVNLASNTGLSSAVASCVIAVSRRAQFGPTSAAATLQVPLSFVHQ